MRRRPSSTQLSLLALALLAAGCQSHPAERARYEAERARYWAERGDIRFALENNPQVRAGRIASGQRHETVAAIADPSRFGAELPADLREDLERLQAQGLVRAGGAYLEGGEFERAQRLLEVARKGPVFDESLEAGWLLVYAYLERPDVDAASEATRDLLQRVLSESPERPPAPRLIELPTRLAQAYADAGDSTGARAVEGWARDQLRAVGERWPQSRVASRARFQLHRLSLLSGRPSQSLDDLRRFESSTTDSTERHRSRLVRAEILAVEMGEHDAARALYQGVFRDSTDPELRGLARLRTIDLMIVEGQTEAAADSLTRFSRQSQAPGGFLAAADARLAELQRQRGDDAAAIQAYRRLVLRFPDTMAALVAPMEVLEIQRAQPEDGAPRRGEEFALRQAVDHFRRVLASHPGDSILGRLARRNLVECLREIGDAQGALLEAEQLFHSVGPTHSGMEALILAARIAAEDLDQPQLAIAYLSRVEEEWPGSAEAREAQAYRASLEAGGSFPPGSKR